MNFYGNEANVGFLEANISSNEAPFPCWEYLTLTLTPLHFLFGFLETRISMIENEMWVPEGHITGMLQEHTNATQSFHNQASTFHGRVQLQESICALEDSSHRYAERLGQHFSMIAWTLLNERPKHAR